jgi:hypothetical protein
MRVQPRLKTSLRVSAIVRRSDRLAIPAFVVRKGDPDAGALLLRITRRDQLCIVLSQTRTPEGELVWMRGTGAAPVDAAAADAYIERQARRDPDLWVVEVETDDEALPVDERIL